ncbi:MULTISPECIES: pyridoxamine 5'-phosphate oxidase family protein [unclassified Cryobacterium]|uniref:pyridoxamine 5'-phosphate oxidase family protein n=3 Tax=Cryobacterium TaxID=69578 RepID=UPI002AB361EA|nr:MULTISPECIES: pyridoxamine 5'-phosphate oxidase family protein [unclassified Cryobacterium]MDY7556575.1 pyridoxamine 5'-phosphate oxidase family protein [Cryobacterium sp. 10C3]MEB0288956.1 pyridoxamine 5'-phosphate oxidase family protein [Cryobacterium sp. 10C2]
MMTMIATPQLADVGFHAGELAVQRQAGVTIDAARLSGMLGPVTLTAGMAGFLSDRTFLVISGRDRSGRLWTSPLVGRPGFLEVLSDTSVAVHAVIPPGDPLRGLQAGQKIGMVTVEFATRRRVRINGALTVSGGDLLVVDVEQAFGNCPQYIQQRVLVPDEIDGAGSEHVRHGSTLSMEDRELISAADTFFLGTVTPERGSDASHRGGPSGFVRIDGHGLWWPDYKGNNLFNSFGNITVNPEAALLFIDFATGKSLQLSGTTQIEWGEPGRPGDDGHTGRIARFTLQRLVAGQVLPVREITHTPYPRNLALTD